jgi:hypothetical protein
MPVDSKVIGAPDILLVNKDKKDGFFHTMTTLNDFTYVFDRCFPHNCGQKFILLRYSTEEMLKSGVLAKLFQKDGREFLHIYSETLDHNWIVSSDDELIEEVDRALVNHHVKK